MDDRIAGANVMTYYDGEARNWHFDRSEFTTTLLLQAPSTAVSLSICAICGQTIIQITMGLRHF